jgi:glycosyltransferase involved in cell wall biosynthesis
MTVGLVAPTLQLLGGHAVQAARLLKTWQADSEVQLRLVPINPPLPSLLTPLGSVKYLRTVLRAIQFWRSLLRQMPSVDVLHVFATSNTSFFLTAAPAIVVGRLLGKAVVVNYHGDSGEHLTRSAATRWILSRAQAVIVPSMYFEAIFGRLGMRARVIPNVADLGQFRYRARPVLRPRLVSTRNLEPIYNVTCTLRAFAVVQQRYPDATLVLVGTGSEDQRLRRQARQLGLRNVTFAGAVSAGEMHRIYDSSDIYVQTPVIDNMPGSLIEALASGLPTVATNVGGVPFLVQDGVHALLVPSDDEAAVARQVLALIEDPARASQIAAAAAVTCGAYDAPIVRELWRRLYRDLLDRPAKNGSSAAAA